MSISKSETASCGISRQSNFTETLSNKARVGGTRIIDCRRKRVFGRKRIIRNEGGYVRSCSELSGEVPIGVR